MPFIARSHHEDIVAELRQQIAKLETQNQKTTDLLLTLSVGRPLYAEFVEEKPVTVEPSVEPEPEPGGVQDLIQRTGSHLPSRLRRQKERDNAVAFARARKQQTVVQPAVEDMAAAFEQGKSA